MQPQLSSSIPLWRIGQVLTHSPLAVSNPLEKEELRTHAPWLSAPNCPRAVGYMSWWSHLCLLMGVSEAESPTLLPLLQPSAPGLSHSLNPTDALVSLGL